MGNVVVANHLMGGGDDSQPIRADHLGETSARLDKTI
jgi:hypothetical protein